MIKSQKVFQGFVNDVTRYLDLHTIKSETCNGSYYNYIYPDKINNCYPIRLPGATRGHIKVIDHIITEIKLYEDSFCYDEKVYNELDKFIGKKIDLI